jgi:transcriptional regulator with XRE-family HTH domain
MGIRIDNMGEAIRRILDEELLTIEQFSKKIGLSYSGTKKIINGEYSGVNRSTIKRIAEAFNRNVIIKDYKIEFPKKDQEPQTVKVFGKLSKEDYELLEYIKSLGIGTKRRFIEVFKPVLTKDLEFDERLLQAVNLLRTL